MLSAGPVVCFGYLAAAELWKVARFPLANDGAEIVSVERSIAADATMTAAVLSALDVPTLLLANDVGDDATGAAVGEWLVRHDVNTIAEATVDTITPQIVVVADDDDTRTWFPYLPGVVDALAALDLSAFASASFAYIDCYQLIGTPAVRAIHAARAADVPLLLNLGGSPLLPTAVDALRAHPRLVVQTNVNDNCTEDAPQVAASILTATGAAWVVVTAGAAGALALSQAERFMIPAFRVPIRHTHCAGAAFSGGLLYGLLHGWPIDDSLRLACASGALRCERAHDEPMPTLDELYAVIGSCERIAVPTV
jgi:sugar/nucleoside kinase (ribokinase family)